MLRPRGFDAHRSVHAGELQPTGYYTWQKSILMLLSLTDWPTLPSARLNQRGALLALRKLPARSKMHLYKVRPRCAAVRSAVFHRIALECELSAGRPRRDPAIVSTIPACFTAHGAV